MHINQLELRKSRQAVFAYAQSVLSLILIVALFPQTCFAQVNLNPPLQNSDQEQRYSVLENRTAPTPTVQASKAQTPAIQQSAQDRAKPSQVIDASQKLNDLLTQMVLENMPHQYQEDKDWGGQEKRWDGIKFRLRDNGKLGTKRRWKMVNHGTWKKYSAELIDPKNEFNVELKNIRQAASGATAFDVCFTAHLKVHGRQSKWAKGVQLYSFSGDGHAKIRLIVSCEMSVGMELTKFPPDLIFSPTATAARIVVDEFRIDRISKLGGEFAQQVSRQARKVMDRKIAEKQHKLVEKINRQLTRKKDELRLSIADAVKTKWSDDVKPFLPSTVQSAIDATKSKK